MTSQKTAQTTAEVIEALYPDECARHGTPAKKDYEFGKYHDATLTTYKGCQCAAIFNTEGFNDPGRLYPSYAQASGAAKMIVRMADSMGF